MLHFSALSHNAIHTKEKRYQDSVNEIANNKLNNSVKDKGLQMERRH